MNNKIDPNKTYRTRKNHEYRLYAMDGEEPYCVHGAIKKARGWRVVAHTINGFYVASKGLSDVICSNPYDLVEVSPYEHIAIDAFVKATCNGQDYFNAHFAGCNSDGLPCVWTNGRTSKTSHENSKSVVKHVEAQD